MDGRGGVAGDRVAAPGRRVLRHGRERAAGPGGGADHARVGPRRPHRPRDAGVAHGAARMDHGRCRPRDRALLSGGGGRLRAPGGARGASRLRSRRSLPAVRRRQEDGEQGTQAVRRLGLPQVQPRHDEPPPVRLGARRGGAVGRAVRDRVRPGRGGGSGARGRERPGRGAALAALRGLAAQGRLQRPLFREVAHGSPGRRHRHRAGRRLRRLLPPPAAVSAGRSRP